MTWVPAADGEAEQHAAEGERGGVGGDGAGERAQRERDRDEHDRLLAAVPLREVAAQERPEDRSGEDARGDDGLPPGPRS
jgi:hypothetical protein